MVCHEVLEYREKMNWANDVIGLRKKYNLFSDNSIKKMQMKSTVRKEGFMQFQTDTSLPPELARLVYRAKI